MGAHVSKQCKEDLEGVQTGARTLAGILRNLEDRDNWCELADEADSLSKELKRLRNEHLREFADEIHVFLKTETMLRKIKQTAEKIRDSWEHGINHVEYGEFKTYMVGAAKVVEELARTMDDLTEERWKKLLHELAHHLPVLIGWILRLILVGAVPCTNLNVSSSFTLECAALDTVDSTACENGFAENNEEIVAAIDWALTTSILPVECI